MAEAEMAAALVQTGTMAAARAEAGMQAVGVTMPLAAKPAAIGTRVSPDPTMPGLTHSGR